MRDTLEQLRFVEPPQSILCRRQMRPALSVQQSRLIAAERKVSIVRGSALALAMSELPGEDGWLQVAQGAPSRTSGKAQPVGSSAAADDSEAEPTSWLPSKYYSSPPGARCVSTLWRLVYC
jgi:hypothetical protein